MNFIKTILTSLFILLLTTSCKNDGGTTGGNPLTAYITSKPYTNDGTVAKLDSPILKFLESMIPIEMAFAAPVSSFEFCITKIKVVSSSNGSPSASREAILGLIDVSDSTTSYDWGKIGINEGEKISELHLEIHQDAENCSGANYSLSYNGTDITKDLEFKFKFNPAISVEHGSTLQLDLSVIAKAIEDASYAGHLTNEQIGNYLQTNTIGTGTKL